MEEGHGGSRARLVERHRRPARHDARPSAVAEARRDGPGRIRKINFVEIAVGLGSSGVKP
jgi:hypothetical protein